MTEQLQCATHRFAAGPDGLCVRCRVGDARAARRVSASTVAALTLVAVSIVAFAYARQRAAQVEVLPSLDYRIEQGSERARIRAEPVSLAAPASSVAPTAAAPTRSGGARSSSSGAPTLPTPVGPAASMAIGATAPLAADLATARRSVDVTIYTASWCGWCRKAKAWLGAHEVRFVERDVEASATNDAECRRYNPSRSLPTLVIDGAVIVGYTEDGMRRAIDAAAQRRAPRHL